MKTGMVVMFAALVLLAGCKSQDPNSGIPITPKWKGAPYRLSFGAAPAKANPAGLTLPAIKFVANPEMVESRAVLVIKIDTSEAKAKTPVYDKIVMAATDIHGADGALSDDYVNLASTDFAKMLASDCLKGKVKVLVALTRSSLPSNPTDDQINAKRLSDWTPVELDFKNPHPKC